MNIGSQLLKGEEKAVFKLRSLYEKFGYTQYRMSKFEEYELYVQNKNFLISDNIITFTENGKLMALKPDVTLSIVKSSKNRTDGLSKLYYDEKVYRSNDSGSFKEIMQVGLECIGNITKEYLFEVIGLAAESLACINKNFVLHLSDISLLNTLLCEYGVSDASKDQVLTAITEKNMKNLKNLLNQEQYEALSCLIGCSGCAEAAISRLKKISKAETSLAATLQLEAICTFLSDKGYADNLTIDFSIAENDSYYSGIVFKGFINGLSSHILSGGQYDKLMARINRTSGAVGFAVSLDALERISEIAPDDYVNIALPKGRLGEKVYAMFEKAGYDCPSIKEENRKLIFENEEKKLRFFWVKPSDMAIYVERGAADIGVAGKDILLEYQPDVFELLDMKIGKCKMAVAAKKDFCDDTSKTLRVATKFSNIAQTYYAKKCRDIDIIHLNGSIEIAPILGLSDVIVDIVETGRTLLENDLAPYETIVPISARLIANKAAYGFKAPKIEAIKASLFKEVEKND